MFAGLISEVAYDVRLIHLHETVPRSPPHRASAASILHLVVASFLPGRRFSTGDLFVGGE